MTIGERMLSKIWPRRPAQGAPEPSTPAVEATPMAKPRGTGYLKPPSPPSAPAQGERNSGMQRKDGGRACLADDVIRGIAAILRGRHFGCNGPRAEVFVGESATVCMVPPIVQAAIFQLRRVEPTNRRLWSTSSTDNGPVFDALAERGYLIAPHQRHLVRVSLNVPAGDRVRLRRFNALALPNALLWIEGEKPKPYEGPIAFAELRNDRPFHIPGFTNKVFLPGGGTLSNPLPEPSVYSRAAISPRHPDPLPQALLMDLGWRLLKDLAQAAHRRHLGFNKAGSQLYLQGDLAHLVVPAAIHKALRHSPNEYPEPVAGYIDDYLNALGSTNVLKPAPGGRYDQVAEIEGCKRPMRVITMWAAALLGMERRSCFGDFEGCIRFPSQPQDVRP